MSYRLTLLRFCFLAICISLLACGDIRTPGSGPQPTITAIIVTPLDSSVEVNSEVQFSANAVYSDGSITQIDEVMWQSSNLEVLEISPTGLGTTFSVGEVKVVAIDVLTGKKGETNLSIVETNLEPLSLVQIEIVTDADTLGLGEEIQLSVRGRYSDGSMEYLQDISWISSEPQIATVDDAGFVLGLGSGTTTISAIEPTTNLSSSLSLSVVSNTDPQAASQMSHLIIHPANSVLGVHEELVLAAIAVYADGSSEALTSGISWSSSDNSIATISSTGSVLGISEGTAQIRLNHYSSGFNATRELSVQNSEEAGILTSLVLSSPSPTLTIGSTLQLLVTGTLNDGTTLDFTDEVQWESSDELVAAVQDNGRVRGISEGLVVIRVSSGAIEATISLQIVEPNNDSTTPGDSGGEGSEENPLDLSAPLDGVQQGNYVSAGGKSYYRFPIEPGTFYSILISDLTGDADLYNYDNDGTYRAPVCMGAKWGREDELCEFQRAGGDAVYFMVDGSFSVNGARYTIAIHVYEPTILGAAPNSYSLSIQAEKRLYVIPAQMGIAQDVAVSNPSFDVDLYVYQAPFYCAGVTVGLSGELCPNQIPFDDHFYVFVDGSYSEEGANFELELTTSSFEEETLELSAAPLVHFGEVGIDTSIYSVNVSPGRRYDLWLTNMTANVDLWVYGSDSTFQVVECSSATDNELEKCEGIVAGTDKLYLAVDGSRTNSGAAFAFSVALAP